MSQDVYDWRGSVVEAWVPSSFVHPLAYVEPTCSIGDGSRIWQYASITRGARIGKDCNIAPHVSLDGCVLGNGCIARPSVDIGPGIEVGNDVFLGPLVCLANDMWPATSKEGFDYEALIVGGRKVIVIEDGATLGAHVVVVPGVRIGAGAFICANVCVTRDVPAGMVLTRDGNLLEKPKDWQSRRMRYVR
jgi:acetyltransferase-like isoleucine patch superfamily enzyme